MILSRVHPAGLLRRAFALRLIIRLCSETSRADRAQRARFIPCGCLPTDSEKTVDLHNTALRSTEDIYNVTRLEVYCNLLLFIINNIQSKLLSMMCSDSPLRPIAWCRQQIYCMIVQCELSFIRRYATSSAAFLHSTRQLNFKHF